jgi:hypothetical protein
MDIFNQESNLFNHNRFFFTRRARSECKDVSNRFSVALALTERILNHPSFVPRPVVKQRLLPRLMCTARPPPQTVLAGFLRR